MLHWRDHADQPTGLLASAADDGRALLAAAGADWDRRIPDCPAWNAGELVGHMGAILAWMATIVTTGQAVARKDRESPPADRRALPAWYEGHLARTLTILGEADSGTPAWTFSSRGDHRAGWWQRRLAVEIAIHRWDAQFAMTGSSSTVPDALDNMVAAAGIGEFLTEFLPGMLETAGSPVRETLCGTLRLNPTDRGGEQDRWQVELDPRTPVQADYAPASMVISGSCSDLLLWLTNRHTSPGPRVIGEADTAQAWLQLRR